MNVKELKELLSQYPDDTMLVISGYEGGLNEVSSVREVNIDLNVNSDWYYGSHEETDNPDATKAIYIG